MDLFKLIGSIVIKNQEAIDAVNETTGAAKKSSGGMVGAFKKVGAAVGTYLAADQIISFGKGCISAAADANAMNSQFSQVFGDLESTASKNLSGIADTAGITENRMKGSYTKIAAFAKTTGMDTEGALGLADRAMIAVADSAAFYDRSLEETTESLQSFLKGNYENDAALGLSCTETTRNAAANELYGKSFNDLSESQKQLTLLKMVEDANAASGALGQAARESETWTNQTGNLKQAWTDFQSALGKPILDYAVQVVGWLADKVGNLTEKFTSGQNPVETFIGKIQDGWKWCVDIGTYIGETLSPIIDDLGIVFTKVKDAVQPLIDKLVNYVTQGGLVEDVTNGIKSAVDFLASAYENIVGFVETVVTGFQNAVEWGKQHETTVTLVAIAIGTLTAAIGAYNIAQAIQNAGGVIELLRLAETAIGYYALTAAETAHTVATTAATAATSAFGAVLAFITHPVTLVVLAIGALIAIGVALYQNWDVIKQKCSELWSNVTQKFTELKDSVSEKMTALKDGLSEKWEGMKTAASEKWESIKSAASEKWSAIKSQISEKAEAARSAAAQKWDSMKSKASSTWENIKSAASSKWTSIKSTMTGAVESAKSTISSAFNTIKSTISSALNTAKSVVSSIFSAIKSVITGDIDGAKNAVKSAIDAIKGFFNFTFKWPNLPLPHFSISPSGWKVGDLLDGSIPTLGISWYAKAMDNPMIMNEPSIFGYNPATGELMGGGEAGSEVVSGTDTLMKMIGAVVDSRMTGLSEQLISVLAAILDAIVSGNAEMLQALLAGQTIKINEREFARTVRTYA